MAIRMLGVLAVSVGVWLGARELWGAPPALAFAVLVALVGAVVLVLRRNGEDLRELESEVRDGE